MGTALENPARPFVVLGSVGFRQDRVIKNLINKSTPSLSAAACHTFIKAMGHGVGNHLLRDKVELAKQLMEEAEEGRHSCNHRVSTHLTRKPT